MRVGGDKKNGLRQWRAEPIGDGTCPTGHWQVTRRRESGFRKPVQGSECPGKGLASPNLALSARGCAIRLATEPGLNPGEPHGLVRSNRSTSSDRPYSTGEEACLMSK